MLNEKNALRRIQYDTLCSKNPNEPHIVAAIRFIFAENWQGFTNILKEIHYTTHIVLNAESI